MHRYPLSILFLRQVVFTPKPEISPEHKKHKTAQAGHRYHAAKLHYASHSQTEASSLREKALGVLYSAKDKEEKEALTGIELYKFEEVIGR